MTKLIALAALAAGAVASLAADVAVGDPFEVTPEDAEKLLTEGAAKLADAPLSEPKKRAVQARVLVGCAHGQPDDVVSLAAEVAKQAEAAGQVDTNKAAIAYALSLKD